jgi:hypothetical protein
MKETPIVKTHSFPAILGNWCLTHDVPWIGKGHAIDGKDDTENCVQGVRPSTPSHREVQPE